MTRKAVFAGLVVDENERPVEVAEVGGEAFYVIDDSGFRRHVESDSIDRQVLEILRNTIRGQEEAITEGTMRMIGQEDIFTKAAIEQSLKGAGSQLASLIERGLPEEARAWLGMMGFRVVVDLHGQVVRVDQPAAPEEGQGE